jgi:aspartyl-tRNA(Asn)/glutamyl-tRNA(Gln) amidotransferase subunit C
MGATVLPDVVEPSATTFFVATSVQRKTFMHLTSDDVRHVADLARLHLTDEEVRLYTQQLSAILDYAERLQEVDTSGVPPTPYVLPLQNVMAEDIPQPSLPNEVALANAPDKANGFFRVRAVFEE